MELRLKSTHESGIPLLEVAVHHAVREALAADADALEHAVAMQLVEHEVRVNVERLLELVRDDAANKVRVRAVQRGHQLVQRLLHPSKCTRSLRIHIHSTDSSSTVGREKPKPNASGIRTRCSAEMVW